jgi:L,D-transpeptidase ErfK/SrfK
MPGGVLCRALPISALVLVLAALGAPAAAATYPLPPHGESVVGRLQWVAAGPQDTLSDIARRYDLGYDELREANPHVDPWLPGAGTRVVLPTRFVLPPGPRKGVVLNVPEMRLYYYLPARRGRAREVVTYPVGIGREGWQTPVGVTRIVARIPNPAWYPPASIRKEHAAEGDVLSRYVPPGPDNPLGRFALQLGVPGYLIHGTNRPSGVGMAVSHGCVRLYPEDIRALFDAVRVGTKVRLVHELYKVGWQGGRLYLGAHRPLTPQGVARALNLTPVVRLLIGALRRHPGYAVDWDRVRRLLERPPGIPVPVGVGDPGLRATLAAAVRIAAVPDAGAQEKKPAPQTRGARDAGS